MITRKALFDSQEFENQFHYDGKSGSFCSDAGTWFYLWAPTAEQVFLQMYSCGDGGELLRIVEMAPGEKGVWSYQTEEKLDGIYYTYKVTVAGISRETADPYAVAAGVNGMRSMVVDLRNTNPEGFAEDKAPAIPPENIIYEIHVRDFSWHEASGISPEKRGKYLGLCEAGTTLYGDGEHATGMDYLKELGVTHLQLMPVYDYGSVDERNPEKMYNWGYDPVNFNVPEGSYSSDPYHGEVRIKELKQTIMTLHQNGFRVIMDVVYNHLYDKDSWLNRTVPDYYFREFEDGTVSNGSGCGNDTASERSMCAKYILDSVLYWAEEYHFDGFRFDLMGLIPVELMNRIRVALDERFGEGEKLVYGEPWRAGRTAVVPGKALADKGNLTRLLPGVGAFCDSTRDAVKGNLMNENARGFVNGGWFDLELMKGCLKGWSGVPGEYSVQSPSQTIGYLSCHDDWTLWDRLVNTLKTDVSSDGNQEEILRANRLAAAILMSCQGNVFIHAGEEFGRTKHGIKNTYRSPIEINCLNWQRAWQMKTLKDYYRGLIALRKRLACLTDKSAEAGRCFVEITEPAEGCAMAKLWDDSRECRWNKVILLYNMKEHVSEVELPGQSWQVLVDGQDSFCWQKSVWVSGRVAIPAGSALFVGQSVS